MLAFPALGLRCAGNALLATLQKSYSGLQKIFSALGGNATHGINKIIINTPYTMLIQLIELSVLIYNHRKYDVDYDFVYVFIKQTNKQTKTDYSSISFFVLERLLMIMRGFNAINPQVSVVNNKGCNIA